MSTELSRSIVLTLAYTAQFGFPLTPEEVWERLIQSTRSEFLVGRRRFFPQDKELVIRTLQNMVDQKLLFYDGSYVSVRPQKTWVHRDERAHYAEKKLQEARGVSQHLQRIPWLLALGVSGSVAVGNAAKNDDIDFVIVTQKNHLWLTRLWVTAVAFLHGKRRSWNHEEENSWCFNLWLEQDALAFRPKRGITYVAYELCQVKWLFQRKGALNQVVHHNNWVSQRVPHLWKRQQNSVKSMQSVASIIHLTTATGILNELAYLMQRLYMQRHITRERVSRSVAFFHPRDTVGEVRQRWRQEIVEWSAYVRGRGV